MTASTAADTGTRPAPAAASASRAVTRLGVRAVRRGALVVGVVVAGMCALVVVQYQDTIAGTLDSAGFRALADNPAIRILFGRPVALEDPGGFTVWRLGTVMGVLVAVWALLTATRVTRGEEDAGRWSLLVSGRLTLPTAVTRQLAVVLAAQVFVGACLALAMLAAGARAAGSLLFGAGVALIGAFFAALGVLTAQLLAPRRSAAAWASAGLVLALLVRMLADSADGLAWLRWLSPFGLLAAAQPFSADRVVPLVVLAVAAAAVAVAAVRVAHGRDVGGAVIGRDDSRAPRTRLLGSAAGFATRRTLRPVAAWALGLGAYFLLVGLLTQSMTDFLRENARFAEMAAQAGFADLSSVEGYAASLFQLLGVPVGLFAAARFAADAGDEHDGRFTPLFATSLSRRRWAWTHAAVVAAGCVALLLVAGLATWAGATLVGAGLSLPGALGGALTLLPVALLSAGAALLALGLVPSAVFSIGALPAVGGFLLIVLVDALGWPDWVERLSPYSHLAAVPAQPAQLAPMAVMALLAVGSAWVGAAAYARRDLRV